MIIRFIYTNNNLIGSTIISAATRFKNQSIQNVPSHFSILLWDWVLIESTLANGLSIKPYVDFKKKNVVLREFTVSNQSFAKELAMRMKGIVNKKSGSKYDFRGAIYVGLAQLLNTLFNRAKPTTNKYNDKDKFFCNEIFGLIFNKDVSMEHPNSLMEAMTKDARFKLIP